MSRALREFLLTMYLRYTAPEEQAIAKPKKLKPAKGAEKEKLLSADAAPTKAAKKDTKKSKKAAPAKEPTPEEESEESTPAEDDAAGSDNESADEEDNEEVIELAADLDSEDEDAAAAKAISQFQPGQDVGEIPKLSKKAKKEAKKASGDERPGVVYVGRIPHGFYEHEMRQYFSQFGEITRLRLSRNKRTGASKHFAFVEFSDESTAEIVAKTMDNYLLFGHILRCKVVPPERVHKDLWKGANRRFKIVPWAKMVGKELAKPIAQSGWERRVKKENKRRAVKAAKLKEMGYEFEPPALKAVPAPAPVEEAPAEEMEGVEAEEPAKALPEPAAEEKAEEKTEEPEAAPAPKAKKAAKTKKAKAKA